MVDEKTILIAAAIAFVGFVGVSLLNPGFGVTTDDERIEDGCLAGGHAGGTIIRHDHIHVDIFIEDENGVMQHVSPLTDVGSGSSEDPLNSPCMRFIHTHTPMPHSTTGADDTTAYLHIETPTELEIELRHWFTIWGEEFSETNLMGYETGETHEIVVTYNGEPVEDYMSLVIEAGTQDDIIKIEYRSKSA